MLRAYPLYPLGIDQVIARLRERGSHVFPPLNLCMGSSAYESKRYLELDALKEGLASLLLYGDLLGELDLRSEIAAMLSRRCGTEIAPSRVLITDGASGALAVALMFLVEPGEEVILPAVYFPAYPTAIHLVGATCRFGELDDNKNLTAASVARARNARTAAVIINSPGNPLGNVLSRAELAEIAEVGVPVISDEVYLHLGTDPDTASMLDVTQEHFVCGSFSKTYAAAGLRVGYLVAPERYMETAFAIRVTLNVCPSLPSQRLALALLRNHDSIVREHRAYLQEHRAFFTRCCELHGLRLTMPSRDGFFALVDVREQAPRGTLQLALDLAAEVNLATAPGTDFALSDPGFLRINYGCDLATLETGLARLRAYLHNNR